MTQIATRILVVLGAISTFFSGVYGVLYRSPTNLLSELQIYCGASAITLLPFLALFLLAKKERTGNWIVAFGGITMGIIGAYIYLAEMVFSHEASWGFSILIAPAMQLVCLVVVWPLLALRRRST
jgi:hypothetical protein